ncbi:dipeptidase E [Streptacidiphilus sp. MAP12-33]|uniref:Type 1 glutamine amidotransferase-like domain-containing protein n=1 Tax=Streptacidiphilus sp. MAP12-33 TaxID=3156266 RepID=UPI00351133AF
MTIIAMGGGGFSMESTPWMDDYVLAEATRRSPRPRVAFLGTASGESENYLLRFYRAFGARAGSTAEVSLFRRQGDLRSQLLEQDVIYVGGGNTANMLAVWRAHGADRILAEAHAQGAVLAGVSAGAMCWFEGGVTDSFGDLAVFEDGLGLLPGGLCPHYDEPGRRALFHAWAAAEGHRAGYAADDGAALVFRPGAAPHVVTTRPDAAAYRITSDASGHVSEERLVGERLG